MTSGHNIQLTPQEIEQAIRARVYEIARARGLHVPADPLDFQNRGVVHPLPPDQAAQPASGTLASVLGGVMITWND